MTNKQKARKFVNNNRKLLQQGKEFNDSILTQAFGIRVPDTEGMNTEDGIKAVQQFQSKKAGAQKAVNDLLVHFGMYMSQKQYSNYRIRDRKETAKKVKTLAANGRAKIRFSAKLAAGIQRHKGKLGVVN